MEMTENSTVIAVLPFLRDKHGDLSLLSDDNSVALVERVSSYFLGSSNDGEPFVAALKNLTANVSAADTGVKLEPVKTSVPRHFPRLGLIVGAVGSAGLEKLRSDPDVVDVVAGVSPRMVYDVELLQEPAPQRSWSLDYLKIPDLWSRGLTGKGVGVGHLDSGIDGGHPALKRPLKAFAVIEATGQAKEAGIASDNHGHGTHTAGILCAQPTDGVTVGVAPDISLYSGQITGEGALMRLLGGLEWLLGKDVRLISLSAGVEPFNPVFQVVVDRLRMSNILPIVAIGNDFSGASYSPANYRNALGIGSISNQGQVADSSCSQDFVEPPPYSKPDLVAPGVSILSTRRFGGYEIRSGTSQAAPCVVGVAALLMQAFPKASIAEIEHRIVDTCLKLDGALTSRQGRGVVNPIAALNALLP